jgi:hemerythrin
MRRIEAITGSDTNKARFELLVDFERLAVKYFEREQALHAECCYHDAERHKYTHKRYLTHLQKIVRNFVERGPTLENEMIFIREAVESLKKHIIKHDKDFAAFYIGRATRVSTLAESPA